MRGMSWRSALLLLVVGVGLCTVAQRGRRVWPGLVVTDRPQLPHSFPRDAPTRARASEVALTSRPFWMKTRFAPQPSEPATKRVALLTAYIGSLGGDPLYTAQYYSLGRMPPVPGLALDFVLLTDRRQPFESFRRANGTGHVSYRVLVLPLRRLLAAWFRREGVYLDLRSLRRLTDVKPFYWDIFARHVGKGQKYLFSYKLLFFHCFAVFKVPLLCSV